MTNNITVKDSLGATQVVKTTETSGVHVPHQNVNIQINGIDLSDSNLLPVELPDGGYTPPVSLTATGNFFTVDCLGYSSAALGVSNVGAGNTIVVEVSNDNSNWFSVAGYDISSNGSTPSSTTITTTGVKIFPCLARYMRAKVTSYTSGTLTADILLRKDLPPRLGVSANVDSVTPNAATGGLSTFNTYVSTASNNLTAVSTSASTFSNIIASNTSTNWRWLKLFNASSVTMGTTAPTLNIGLPPGATTSINIASYVRFGTALRFAITTGVALLDNTSVPANEVTLNFLR